MTNRALLLQINDSGGGASENKSLLGGDEDTTTSGDNWSTDQPDMWNYVAGVFKDQWGFANTTMFKPRVDYWAGQFQQENGRWPSPTELFAHQGLMQSMGWLASGGAYLEPYFMVIDDETNIGTVYFNDVMRGPQAQKTIDFNRAGTAGLGSTKYPIYEDSYFQGLLAGLSPIEQPKPRSGGGGSRGRGRQPAVFDRAQLTEGATDRWRGLMLEEPAMIDSVVDDYMKDANAFWMSRGGQLDFDTYVLNKMRDTARYSTLYGRKPEHLSEEEYIGQYASAVGRFGLNPRATRREVEAGLQSGAGAAGFTERVSRTREVQNQAGFSQRLAQTVAGLGSIVRS